MAVTRDPLDHPPKPDINLCRCKDARSMHTGHGGSHSGPCSRDSCACLKFEAYSPMYYAPIQELAFAMAALERRYNDYAPQRYRWETRVAWALADVKATLLELETQLEDIGVRAITRLPKEERDGAGD